MTSQSPLALWGGHECSVNRTGDVYRDQTVLSGHQDRIDDLDRFADLGLTTLRYPILWERVCPEATDQFDWAWSDLRLKRLRDLGIKPIVGLLHHGSGPAHTGLLDPQFPARFGAYAGEVARRYPWITDWTPINEPLTTARFTCLYGLWHPHAKDERTFWVCLLNQIDATIAAMKAVRRVIPAARLVQTEDLGKTYSTPALSHQAFFDNARRWMTWDLLAGAVKPDHALWQRLCAFGFENRLRAIADHPCPADVIGVNHYVASDRFLDHRLAGYPPEVIGGNDFMSFADVAAARVLLPAPDGLGGVLREAWARYGQTLAVTECHIGCTREEQLRWLTEGWETAMTLRARGADVEAVTVWSLLGAFDWDSLLTRSAGSYEPGAFDIRGPAPRPTALAAAVKDLIQSRSHANLAGEGWWRRDVRLQYCPAHRDAAATDAGQRRRPVVGDARPILILGAGAVARSLARACEWRGIAYERCEVPDLRTQEAAAELLRAFEPWAVVNAHQYASVEAAEKDARRCFSVNVRDAINLAREVAVRDLRLLAFSSDLVFDGAADRAYDEADSPYPLSVFGLSMAQGEVGMAAAMPQVLIVRTGPTFSPHDPDNFACRTLRDLNAGLDVRAHDDQFVSPSYLPDLASAALDLLIDGEGGIWHLANEGALSWADYANRLAADGDVPGRVVAIAMARSSAGPRHSVLRSSRGVLLPSFDDALQRFLNTAYRHASGESGGSGALAEGAAPARSVIEATPGTRAS